MVVTGIYFVGPEQQIFYDPEEPECDQDVQPSTWVEFAQSPPGQETLAEVLKKDRRARVTFRGVLDGPKTPGPDEKDFPPDLAFIRRTEGRRYGHLNSFRTRLEVQEVVEAEPVPSSVPWSAVWNRRAESVVGPTVTMTQLPRYPQRALHAGLVGDVVVRTTFVGGRAATIVVESGDRQLAAAAKENLRSWLLGDQAMMTISTVFSYRLVDNLSLLSKNAVTWQPKWPTRRV